MDKDASKVKLNKEQKEAVYYKKGPLLIIAGAGTGKTTVITERIKYLIKEDLAKPSEILALTFTEKAASEMEERVDVAMPYGYTQMWISTFHAFCDRILRSEALNIGMDPRYKLMTDSEEIQIFRNNLFKFELDYFRPLGNPNKFIGGMLQHFSRLQDEDISPSEYIAWVEQRENLPAGEAGKKVQSEETKLELAKLKELASAYRTYEEIKVKESLVDFGDLIVKTLKLFRDRPNILAKYKGQFKYVLVDEFQDTNYAQNELVKLIAGKEANITVVADDDQSIYRFRGAAVSNVIQFRKSFPKTKIVVLTKNYRSSKQILDRAYDLIQFNNPDRLEVVEKIDKRLTSEVDPGGAEITFLHEDRVENEAEQVVLEIKNLVSGKNREFEYKDIAILVRANGHADPFIRALNRYSIPYQFLGPGRLFKQPEIVDLISYLRVLYSFEDSVSYFRLLTYEYFDINQRDIAAIGNFSRKYNISLFEASEKIEEIFVSQDTKEKVGKLVRVINKHLKLLKSQTAGQILYQFLEETEIIKKLLNPDTPLAEKRAVNISRFFDKLKSYENTHEDSSVFAVIDWLNLSMELGESPLVTDFDWTKENAVNLLTVHSAKGLEFPVVFMVNLVSQRFPTMERKEQIPVSDEIVKEVLPQGDYHTEEERRLFYVGMTRAKKRLYFTAADYYGDGKRAKKLSPFIFEALGERAIASESFSNNQGKQLSFLDYQTQTDNSQLTTHNPQPVHVDYLSYSQIETFRTCPLHFKLKYIYKVPTPPTSSQSFGTTVHAVFKDFYTKVAEGGKPTEELMFDLLQKDWVSDGYLDKIHEKKFFEKGKVYLSGYLKDGFNPKVLPVVMEHPFTISLTEEDLGRPLKIGGKIDRVDLFSDGTIEIIDYKTGATIPTQKEVDENLQLSFYALAATRIPFEPYGKRPDQVKMTLYYLDSQEKLSTKRSTKDLEESVKKIFETRREIETSEFKCSGHMFCQTGCEYSLFCKSD